MVERPSSLHIIHVLPHLSPTEPGVIWGDIDDASRSAHATQALNEKLSDKYKDAELTIGFGNAAREIA